MHTNRKITPEIPPSLLQLAGLNPTTPRITPRVPIRGLPTPRPASRGYAPSDPGRPFAPRPSPPNSITPDASPAAVVSATPPAGGARPAASLPRRPAGPGGGGALGGGGGGGSGWEDGQASEASVDATETEAEADGELPHFGEWQQRRAFSPE